jgi:hypothetical protein
MNLQKMEPLLNGKEYPCAASLARILEEIGDKKLNNKIGRLFMELDAGLRKLFAVEDKKFRKTMMIMFYHDRVVAANQFTTGIVNTHFNNVLRARFRKALKGENDNRQERLNRERTIAE